MVNALGLVKQRLDAGPVVSYAEVDYATTVFAEGGGSAAAGMTAALLRIVERLLADQQKLTGETPHEILRRLTAEFDADGS